MSDRDDVSRLPITLNALNVVQRTISLIAENLQILLGRGLCCVVSSKVCITSEFWEISELSFSQTMAIAVFAFALALNTNSRVFPL